MFSLTIISKAAMIQAYCKYNRVSVINSGNSVTSNRKKHEDVKMTSLLTVLYVAFCGPFLGMSLLYQLIKVSAEPANDLINSASANFTISAADDDLMNNFDVTETINKVFQLMVHMNGLVDVTIYCILDKDFRGSLMNIFF